jgi:hypothetical protein
MICNLFNPLWFYCYWSFHCLDIISADACTYRCHIVLYSFIKLLYSYHIVSSWTLTDWYLFSLFSLLSVFSFPFTESSFSQTAMSVHRDASDFELFVLVLLSDLPYFALLCYILSNILCNTPRYFAMLHNTMRCYMILCDAAQY